MNLPQEFWTLFEAALAGGVGSDGPLSAGAVKARFEAALEEGESAACVRLNPWKKASLPILEGARPVCWSQEGWQLAKRPVFTLHPLFHAGAYYVQDASSMFVGAVLRRILQFPQIQDLARSRPLRVLDLCAAPGGKTTDAASSLRAALGDGFSLLANEVVPKRFAILRDNVEVWGDPAVSVSSLQPARLGALRELFDIILVDAPCSGEGMFRKEPLAVSQWSRRKVEDCAALQRKILSDIAPSLAPGGYLIYSTCTYNAQENEGSVASLLENPDFKALDLHSLMAAEEKKAQGAGESPLWSDGAVRLIPGLVRGEGQFCALLQKEDRGGRQAAAAASARSVLPPNAVAPANAPECPTSYILDRTRYPNVAVDKQTALNYLHGDCLVLSDAPKGQLLLTYKDIPLGYVKNIGSRCNNLYPKSRRIKIDVTL